MTLNFLTKLEFIDTSTACQDFSKSSLDARNRMTGTEAHRIQNIFYSYEKGGSVLFWECIFGLKMVGTGGEK